MNHNNVIKHPTAHEVTTEKVSKGFTLNHYHIGPWEIWMKFCIYNFQTDFSDWWLGHLFWNSPNMNLTGLHSTLAQVMAWCWQATSHYLSQCWPRSLLPYGVTRPEWVKNYNNIIQTKQITTKLCTYVVGSILYKGAYFPDILVTSDLFPAALCVWSFSQQSQIISG